MKKRKRKEIMKRRRYAQSSTSTLGCLRFAVSNLPPRTQYVISSFSPNGSLEEDEESVDYVIHFRPPLPRAAARNVHVSVVYCGQKIQRARTPYLCHLPVLPNGGGKKYSLREGYLDYELFETHQLRTYMGKTIGSMYLTFENNMTLPDHEIGVYIELKVDMTLYMLPRLMPGEFLMWFPPDVDPSEHGIKVDPRCIPQRTKLWFKLRGISGTKAYTLLGFMIPKLGSEDAKNYNFYKSAIPFSSQQRAMMRLGSISEEYALLAYFSKYQHQRFQEMGWCPAPPKLYPSGWGASPDGLLLDNTMTWNKVSPATASAYKPLGIDVTRGVCEIKTSRTHTNMRAYYIPQMYMEMLSLECAWAHLLRFHHVRSYEDGQWVFRDQLHVYRIERDPKREAQFVEMWKYALDRLDNLVEVVHTTDRFCEMRKELEAEAEKMVPIDIIDASSLDTFSLYTQHRETLVYNAATRTPEEMDASESQQLWGDLNERHRKLLCTDDRKQMIGLISAQMEDYAYLLRQLLDF